MGIQTAECPICKNNDPCDTSVSAFCKVAIGGLIDILQNLSFQRTFGENQTNRRLILSKVSWVYILRRELLQGRRYRPTGRKI
ncbi:MAG: hypothetical protein LBT97_04245, partial [Planctomycetota bacterium]|nr:hypothetical protein [Planctomycetota bacterium]